MPAGWSTGAGARAHGSVIGSIHSIGQPFAGIVRQCHRDVDHRLGGSRAMPVEHASGQVRGLLQADLGHRLPLDLIAQPTFL